MSATIKIDMRGVEKTLTQIEKLFTRQAAQQALKTYGFESRKILQDEMKRKYQHATNYTLRSPRYEVKGSTLRLYINDDQSQNQSAAKYLSPTDRTGGIQQKPIQPTTLSGALRALYGTNKVAVPAPNTRAGRLFIASNGNLKGMRVKTLLSQLSSPSTGYREQYFVTTERKGRLGPGIWRRYRVKNQISLAFALVDQKPKVETQIDFHGLLLEDAQRRLPALVKQKLDRLLGR